MFLREPLKSALTLTLTVVLMLSLLAAIYGAFVLSRRLVAPIQDLVAGTRAVAKGDFDTRLPTPSRDEIGFLISSFNDMTQRLAAARREASLSQALVEAERTNLEVILARLSTGVVALDPTCDSHRQPGVGRDPRRRPREPRRRTLLTDVAKNEPLLEQFVDVARVHLDAGETEWREQIVLRGEVGRRVLTCACTTLPGDEDQRGRLRRRIRRHHGAAAGAARCGLGRGRPTSRARDQEPADADPAVGRAHAPQVPGTMPGEEAQVLDRATHTIVQQVEAMKEMVNAFSDYARAPDMDISGASISTSSCTKSSICTARRKGRRDRS